MSNQEKQTLVREFAAAFARAVSDALNQATGAPCPLEVMDVHEQPGKKAPPVQYRLKADGGLRGECFVEFYEPLVSDLVSRLQSGEAESSADPAKALTPVVVAAASGLSASLAAQFGETTFNVDCVAGLAFGGMFVVPLSGPAQLPSAAVLLYLDGQMLDTLSSGAPNGQLSGAGERPAHPSNLQLVMDVELNVSLRFGQRQLPLREVLELTSGSVIELDRMVDEPVELLLDGKLVARGEAVIVDGNYGLRVTEIPQAVETHFLR
jgi:flagellar motor switch protein FliN